MFRFAGFELDPQRAELRGPDGEAIKLRPKSYDMLLVFVAHAGRVISKTELLEAVWPNIHVGEDSLFQCVREIRVALGDEQRELIKLVSGKGYLFDTDVALVEARGTTPVTYTSSESIPTVPLPAAGTSPSMASEMAAAATAKRGFPFGLRAPATLALGLGICTIIGLAVAAPMLRNGIAPERKAAHAPKPLTVIVMPMTPTADDPQLATLTANVTDRLTDGLAKIDNIRVIAGRPVVTAGTALTALAVSVEAATARTHADFVVDAKLQRSERGFEIEARLSSPSGEVRWAGSAAVSADMPDVDLTQSRLAAGVGHQLARRINALVHAGAPNSDGKPSTSSKVVVEQATALMNQTNRERFKTAQAMLEKARVEEPDNVEIDVALAAVMMRGIQMAWYSPEEKDAVEREGQAVIERAVRTRPNYIPVLESYCRFLNATNQFVESLVVCAKVMAFDPWDGIGLYHMGLAHMQLGRFEDALASFKESNQYDTPQVSRWTWPLGIGMMYTLMGRDEEAIPWLLRSIAITSATGRTHMLLANAYWGVGKHEEARAALGKAQEIRPGSTSENIALPRKNASQTYLKAAARVRQNLIEAGLPEK